MYVPYWFFVLSAISLTIACSTLSYLLGKCICCIVHFVRECRMTYNLVKYHGERMHEIEKRIDAHGTRIYEIEKQIRRFRSR